MGGLRCFNPMLLLPHTSTQYRDQMKCSFSACSSKIEVYVVKCDDEMFYFDVDCVLFCFCLFSMLYGSISLHNERDEKKALRKAECTLVFVCVF